MKLSSCGAVKFKILVCLLLFFSFSLYSQEKYILWYFMKGKASGKILFIIPFRVYYENFASVILETENEGEKVNFYFYDIGFPGYLLRTIDFMGHEIHVRIASPSIKESLSLGEAIMKEWVEEYPEFSKHIKLEKRKVLPFGFKEFGKESFFFSINRNGILDTSSLKCELKPYYLWPAREEIPLANYDALIQALRLFARPFLPSSNEDGEGWVDRGIDLTYEFNLIGRILEQVIRDFVVFKQNKKFDVPYKANENNGIIYIRGEATPNVEIWSGYRITKYIREVEWDKNNRTILRERMRMEMWGKKGRGGYGEMELRKINFDKKRIEETLE